MYFRKLREARDATVNALLDSEEQAPSPATLGRQALRFLLHTLLALAAWAGLMLAGYAVNPSGVPQWAILLLSMVVPMSIGFIAVKIHADEMATVVWLVGLLWLMIVGLWILDMPTAPGACFQCSATEKLTRALFSYPQPSGLIDDDGPFIGTWPATALVGYSMGAWLGMRGRAQSSAS
jgi:hypothetical protein